MIACEVPAVRGHSRHAGIYSRLQALGEDSSYLPLFDLRQSFSVDGYSEYVFGKPEYLYRMLEFFLCTGLPLASAGSSRYLSMLVTSSRATNHPYLMFPPAAVWHGSCLQSKYFWRGTQRACTIRTSLYGS